MVEHAAVNRRVGGSNPSSGAKKSFENLLTAAIDGVFCSCSLDAFVAQR